MEIKINKEIRNYYEAVFLGLPLRAVLFSAAGIVLSLIVGFSLRGKAGTETISWVITLIMLPCFLMGYKKINGMYLEKYLAALIRSEFLTPKKLTLGEDNIYRKIVPAPVTPKPAKHTGFSFFVTQRSKADKIPVVPEAVCGNVKESPEKGEEKEDTDERKNADIQ